MDDHILTNMLSQLRAAPLPSLPGSFRQDVWRAIRQRRPQNSASWVATFFEPFFRPALSVTALIVAMFLGASVGSMAVDLRGTQTREALGLEVFGSSAPTLPATLLSHPR